MTTVALMFIPVSLLAVRFLLVNEKLIRFEISVLS